MERQYGDTATFTQERGEVTYVAVYLLDSQHCCECLTWPDLLPPTDKPSLSRATQGLR